MSAGWHNVTVYEISHVNDDPQNEEIIYSANAQFKIDKAPEAPENSQSKPEPFPTVLFTAVSVAVAAGVAGGVLVYSKKLGGERNS